MPQESGPVGIVEIRRIGQEWYFVDVSRPETFNRADFERWADQMPRDEGVLKCVIVGSTLVIFPTEVDTLWWGRDEIEHVRAAAVVKKRFKELGEVMYGGLVLVEEMIVYDTSWSLENKGLRREQQVLNLEKFREPLEAMGFEVRTG